MTPAVLLSSITCSELITESPFSNVQSDFKFSPQNQLSVAIAPKISLACNNGSNCALWIMEHLSSLTNMQKDPGRPQGRI